MVEFLVILGHFLTFKLPYNLKNQNFEKMKKNPWIYYHSTLGYPKWWSYDVWFRRNGALQTEFFVILDNPENQNFEKNEKNACRCYDFTHVYHKLKSYNVCFLRYVVWRHFFLILNHFLPFHSSNNHENQNFEKMKKMPVDVIILHMCTINENHNNVCFLRYGTWQT